MGDSSDHRSTLSADAVAFVVSLPKRKQRKALDIADRIARHPFRIGDYETRDAAGHIVVTLLVDEFLLAIGSMTR